MKKVSAAMFLTAALSLGVSAFAQTAPTNPTGQVDQPTGQAAPQKPAELKDVPAGHWAQEAIKVAADCGIIRGYPDGTYRGNQPITRYEAAAIVARLIQAIKSGACGIGTPGTSGSSITMEQYDAVLAAIDELRADLAQLGVRVADLEDNAVTQDDLARVEELATQARDIAEQAATAAEDAQATADDAAAAAADAADAAQAAQDAADANAEAIQAAQDAADAAQAAAEDAQAAADAAQETADSIVIPDGGEGIMLGDVAQISDIEDLQGQIDALQEQLDNIPEATPAGDPFDPADLQSQIDDLTGSIDDLQSQIDDLNAQIADMASVEPATGEAFDPSELIATDEDLQAQIDDLNAQIADTQDQISALTDAVAAQQDSIDALSDTTSGLQDDVGTLQDTVADLQDQIDLLNAASGDPEALQGILDAIDAASIAADTALAQSQELQDKVDELDGRVTDLEDGLGELGATVEGQADSIAALNDLVVLLNQDVLGLQDRVAALEAAADNVTPVDNTELVDGLASTQDDVAGLQDDVAGLQDDLDSLREFTTLLRRDQTALADTVGDLEARVGALETKVDAGLAALGTRVSALENNGFTISGSIGLNYYVARTWNGKAIGFGPDFDIDRLGLSTRFSSGDVDNDVNPDDAPVDYADFGRATNVVNDSNGGAAPAYIEGFVQPSLSLKFTFKARPLTEASSAFNTFSISLGLTLVSPKTPYTNAGSGDNVSVASFKLTSLQSRFEIGGAPLVISFGVKPGFTFTNYGFRNGGFGSSDGRGDGFVASLDGAGVIPLGAKLLVAYGSTANNNGDNRYFAGVYGSLELISGLTGGVYYGYEGTDILANALYNNTAYGLNFKGKVFGFLTLDGEWNNQKANTQANAQVATYVKVGLALDPFTVSANYRYIDGSFLAIGSNGSPYKLNQKGFGVNLGANLFGFLDVAAYYDSYSRVDAGLSLPGNKGGATSNARTTFGVSLGFRLIGFDIKVYLDRKNEVNNSGNPLTGATYDNTGAGVTLSHDGSKSGALIGGLNLALGYVTSTNGLVANGTTTTLYAYADTAISLGSIKISPAVWFASQTNANQSDFGFKVGIDTPFLFNSSLSLAGALDNFSGALTGSTTWIKAALSWSNFLLPNSSFSIAFASRSSVNNDGKGFGPSFASPNWFDSSWGSGVAGVNVNTTGLYGEFGYYGLDFSYGIFQLTNNTASTLTWGQAFGITYKLKF